MTVGPRDAQLRRDIRTLTSRLKVVADKSQLLDHDQLEWLHNRVRSFLTSIRTEAESAGIALTHPEQKGFGA
jgi:hypothetical protein